MSDEHSEGRYPDAIGSLVGASRDVARLTRERDEARAQVARFADVLSAVLDAYEPKGVAVWLRSWINHPERRAEAEAGVLAESSGDPLEAGT